MIQESSNELFPSGSEKAAKKYLNAYKRRHFVEYESGSKAIAYPWIIMEAIRANKLIKVAELTLEEDLPKEEVLPQLASLIVGSTITQPNKQIEEE